MNSTIVSPVPLRFNQARRATSDLKAGDTGRETPLPQHEQAQSVPFTLKLQEDARNPGQFQLVLDIGSKLQAPDGLRSNAWSQPQDNINPPTTENENFRPDASSPPMTPLLEKQGWADLDHVPPEFLNKVVPDWSVSFSRSDSTVSTQSKRLAEIKARIKKKGKGYVVRLLKGSSTDVNEIAEVDLGSQANRAQANDVSELDSTTLPAELHSSLSSLPPNSVSLADRLDVFEIGTSNEDGINRPSPAVPLDSTLDPEPHARVLAISRLAQSSIAEEGMSDAETLIPDVHRVQGEQTDVEAFHQSPSMILGRSNSVSSIVKTPTRGLSLIGPVRKRVEKRTRPRATLRNPNLELRRSDAHKSVKHGSKSTTATSENYFTGFGAKATNLRQRTRSYSGKSSDSDQTSDEYGSSQQPNQPNSRAKPRSRHLLADDLQFPAKSKFSLRLQTDVPKAKSAHASPVARRKGLLKVRKLKSSSPSPIDVDDADLQFSPEWQEESHSEILSKASKVLASIGPEPAHDMRHVESPDGSPLPHIAEPTDEEHIGNIPLPSEVEIRPAPSGPRNPALAYWGIALGALSDKVYEGLKLLRDAIGPERPVPKGYVRVRWTCSCGESLYDDFIEQRPNAARLLEAYLNRPRAQTPQNSASQSSTVSSVTSIFDSSSRASTLATPSSTYGGPDSWSRSRDASKYSPSRIRTNNPFSVRMPNLANESWLLTCANEGRLTPKIVHVDVNESRIRSDKDLALSLRDHYDQLHRRWLNWGRLRGLATIEFVQFEVHRNRFADIRATPSMPPRSAASWALACADSEKPRAISEHPYTFEPNDLLPPVGGTYLLHLFKHPNDYDGELITYLRSPKRRQRLEFGMGWGVHLVEGFLAQRAWAFTMGICGIGSAAFAITWTIKKGDVQGAFGVAQWVLAMAVLVIGGIQAWIE